MHTQNGANEAKCRQAGGEKNEFPQDTLFIKKNTQKSRALGRRRKKNESPVSVFVSGALTQICSVLLLLLLMMMTKRGHMIG
jgi:hypothetical protein